MKTIQFEYAYASYEMMDDEKGLYLDAPSWNMLFDISSEEVNKIIEEKEKLLSPIRPIFIEIEYLPYYDINLLLFHSLEKNPEIAEEIYKAIRDNGKLDYIEEDLLLPLEKLDSLSEPKISWKLLDEVFYSMNKKKENTYLRHCRYCDSIDFSDVDQAIEELKKRYSLPTDFGAFEDFDKVDKTYMDAFIGLGEEVKSYEWYGAKLFYRICAVKPYKDYNDEIALIALYLYLYKNELFKKDYEDIYHAIDFMNLLKTVKDSQGKSEEEIVESLIPILSVSEVREHKKSDEDLAAYRKNPTEENRIRFIISRIEENDYYQGYYEYFSSKDGNVLKLRYRGYHYNLRLNYTKSHERNALVFDADSFADIEAPTLLKNRNGFVSACFEEIKERNRKDIITNIYDDLRSKLGKDADLKSVPIELDCTWHVKSELDYDF